VSQQEERRYQIFIYAEDETYVLKL